MTKAGAAALARVSERTIDRARVNGELEPVEYRGHRPLFKRADVIEWAMRREHKHKADPFLPALEAAQKMIGVELRG